MEIEFNPSRIPTSGCHTPVSARGASQAGPEADRVAEAASLKDQWKVFSSIRAEKIDQAKALVADRNYPSDSLLECIAVLLSLHINQPQ